MTSRRDKAAAKANADGSKSSKALRIAFLHPNLGIGGAERLVVDCASALQQSGHTVHMFTNYHDRSHCYPETRDGTLPVTVYGQTRDSIFGRFHVVVAVLRMLYLALVFALWHARDFDVVIVDQVAHPVPLLQWTTRCKVMFYCHFPDQLLSIRGGWLKRLYRLPIDRLEEWSIGRADLILVNSKFTLATFAATFASLRTRVARDEVKVLYPSIDFARYTALDSTDGLQQNQKGEVQLLEEMIYGGDSSAKATASSKSLSQRSPRIHLMTSINRFERKKNLNLAIQAFHLFSQQQQQQPSQSKKGKSSSSSSSSSSAGALPVRLLVCGGYDPVNVENREHFAELRALCVELGLRPIEIENSKTAGGATTLRWAEADREAALDTQATTPIVYFLRSFTDLQRSYLLSHSLCVLYTPSNEHFGIVPVEAMYMRRPVLACSSGGPLETVVGLGRLDDAGTTVGPDTATGFLAEPQPKDWAQAMNTMVEAEEKARASASASSSESLCAQLGANGRRHVLNKFHFDQFQRQLVQHVSALAKQQGDAAQTNAAARKRD